MGVKFFTISLQGCVILGEMRRPGILARLPIGQGCPIYKGVLYA
jgi:hypothetical protein